MSSGKNPALRRIGFSVAILAVALVLLLLLPPVQLHLVRAVAARSAGFDLAIDSVWAGPWGVEIENLRLDLPAGRAQVRVGRADVDFAFWRSLAGLLLDVEAVELSGVQISARLAAGSAEGVEPEPRGSLAQTGIGPLAKLPPRLAVRALLAEGEFRLETARGVEIGGPLQITARSLARDSAGTLQIDSDVRVARSGQALAAAHAGLTGDAAIDDSAFVRTASLSLDVEPSDGGPGLEAMLSAALSEVETFELSLRGTGGSAAQFEANLAAGSRLDVSWNADLAQGIFAAFARGAAVADLSGGSSGQVTFDLTDDSVDFETSTQLHGTGWEAYDPRLAGLGELDFGLQLDGRHTPGVLEADALDVAVASANRGELLQVRAEQPLRYELGEWLLDPQTWGEPGLSIRVSELPLAWFGSLTPTIVLESGALSGALEFVRSEQRRTLLRVVEPIRAIGVQLAPIEDVGIPEFDVSIEPRATLTDGTLEVAIDSLHMTAATGLEVDFTGQAHTSPAQWPRLTWQGNLAASVPALKRIVPQLGVVRAGVSGALDIDALVLGIDQATIGADTANGNRMLAVDLAGRSPLQLQLPLLSADWDAFEPSRAEMQLDRAPIEWVSAFVPELEFSGGELSGRLTASGALGRGLTLEAQEPMHIDGFTPVFRGLAAKSAWTASVRPRVDLRTAGSALVLEDLTVESQRGNSLRADVTVETAGTDRLATIVDLDADFGEFASRAGLRIGQLHWHQKATLASSEQLYTVEELSIDVRDRDGEDFVTLAALQEFTLSVSPFRVSVAGAPGDILRATVSPVRIEQLLPNVLGMDLEGTLPQGEFFGRAEADGALTLVVAEPLVFRDVSVRWGEASLLDRVTASVDYEVSYSGDGLEARSVDLEASGPDGTMLLRTSSRVTAPLSNVRFLDDAAIEFEAHLEPLARQPVLDDLPSLTSGTLSGSLNFANGAETSLQLALQLRGAAAAVIGELADADVTLDAVGVRGERLAVTAPVRLESRAFGVSSLRLDGTLAMNSDGIAELDATLGGERLAVDDVTRFAEFALADDAVPAPADAESSGLTPLSAETLSAIARLRTERDTVPVWSETLNATARLSLDELALSGFGIEGVGGTLELTPDRATLNDVRASLFGAELSAGARVDFDAAQPRPYSLDFRADVDSLELENVFRAFSADAVPLAEGHFALVSTLNSDGLNPLDLALSSRGRLELAGGDGVFRGLAAHAGTGATATRVIGALTFSRELRAVGRMLDGLGEIRFNDAEILLERNSMDRIDLTRFAVESPQLRIGATGVLELAPLRPLLLSPLDADLSIAANGDAAILFDGMGLLEEEADADGYRAFAKSVNVVGTPAAPDVTEFWELLEEAADNARGALGVSLRAINRRLEQRGE